jgi:putative tryptophan/tyrosine transport system substrate-binding protein
MKRREFISLAGGAAVWPLAARAQQTAMPVVGYLGLISPEAQASTVAGVRKGLSETGYVEGRNVTIEFRWAESHVDRFSALAADLFRRRVDVIFANSPDAVRAARAANATVPIVFLVGEDPVKEGLVPSLSRPGGNVTGVSDLANQLAGKLLGLLRDTVPEAAVFAFLINPTHPNAESATRDAQAAADALGRELRVLRAGTERDLDTAFAAMDQLRVGGLLVSPEGQLNERYEQIIALAARHRVPAIYSRRELPVAGGLMSYEPDRSETSHSAGIYIGRILKGEKPADLPVQQAIKFDLVINLKTAKALGLKIPPGVLAQANEVIE